MLAAWAIIVGVMYVVILAIGHGGTRGQMQRGRDALRSYAREVQTQGDNRYLSLLYTATSTAHPYPSSIPKLGPNSPFVVE